MKALLTLLLLICPVQQIEYGDVSELKGVTRIFIDTGPELKLRKEIIKEIEKSKDKIQLEIVSSAEEAEVVLAFSSATNTYLAGAQTNPSGGGVYSSPIYRRKREGSGLVVKLVQGRVRILMDFEDTQKSRLFERHPSTNFAREFVKAFKKANGIK